MFDEVHDDKHSVLKRLKSTLYAHAGLTKRTE